jgi:hypothetical protein
MRIGLLFVVAGACLVPSVAEGQAGRYELGRRVRSFEGAYAAHRDAVDRQRAGTGR